MNKETKRKLLIAMNSIGAGLSLISFYALANSDMANLLGRVLRAFKMDAVYASTYPYCLIVTFALGITILALNFLRLPAFNNFTGADNVVSDDEVENKIVCKLKGYGWDANDFSRGWLITGKTGSGKTAGAIMHLMRQVFLRCSGKYEGLPKWGGVAVDQKGDFWEIVEGFSSEFKRTNDLIMLKTRKGVHDEPPKFRFNIISYRGITRATYAQLIIDCSKSVSGGKEGGDPFWENSARNAIESSFHVTDSLEFLLRPGKDSRDVERISTINHAIARHSLRLKEGKPQLSKEEIAASITRPLNKYAAHWVEFSKHHGEEDIYPEYARREAECAELEAKLGTLCVEIKIEDAREAAIKGEMKKFIDKVSNPPPASSNPLEAKLGTVINALQKAADALRLKKDVAGSELEIECFTSLVSSYRMLTDMAYLELCLLSCSELVKTDQAKALMPEIMRKEAIDACKYLNGEQFMRNAAKETLNSIISFISNFLKPFADPYMREVYCTPTNTCDFSSIDQGKIFTVSMPQSFGVQRRYANTIMKLLFYQHALNRFDVDSSLRPGFNNLIFWADEAQGVVTASANMSDYSVVDRTRAAKATVVFATQSVTSFLPVLTQDQVKVLLLNLANQIHFQAADEDGAKFIAAQIGKTEITERSYSISKGSRTVNLSKKEQNYIRDFELMAMKKFQCVIKHCEQGYLKTQILPTDFSGTIKTWRKRSSVINTLARKAKNIVAARTNSEG